MTNLEKMEALQDASVILHRLLCQTASGTNAVWTILHHANQHINRQMVDLLGDTELDASPASDAQDSDDICEECGVDHGADGCEDIRELVGEHEDTDSLEDRGITLGSYES